MFILHMRMTPKRWHGSVDINMWTFVLVQVKVLNWPRLTLSKVVAEWSRWSCWSTRIGEKLLSPLSDVQVSRCSAFPGSFVWSGEKGFWQWPGEWLVALVWDFRRLCPAIPGINSWAGPSALLSRKWSLLSLEAHQVIAAIFGPNPMGRISRASSSLSGTERLLPCLWSFLFQNGSAEWSVLWVWGWLGPLHSCAGVSIPVPGPLISVNIM